MKKVFELITTNDNMKFMDGLEIKNFKRFKGHDQESLSQGNLYLNGKKLGFISEDAWSGPLNVHIEDKDTEVIKNFIKDNKMTYTYRGKVAGEVDLDLYLSTLLNVKDMIELVKRGKKKTYVYDTADESLASYPYTFEPKFLAHFNKKLRTETTYLLNELI